MRLAVIFLVFIMPCYIVSKVTTKKLSRSQLKEQCLSTLESLAFSMSMLVKISADMVGQKKEIKNLPDLSVLKQTSQLLKTSKMKVHKMTVSETSMTHYLQQFLLVVAQIQEQVLLRVREGLEDDGEGVFTCLPYQEYSILCENLAQQAQLIHEFQDKLRKAVALVDLK